MTMEKREIEGSPERAADRGRGEDLGFPTGDVRPSLGDPDVVRGLVQDFGQAVVGVRADYNGGKLTGEQAQDSIKKLAQAYGDKFMGRDARFAALPWNSPEHLGQRIKHAVPDTGDTDPGAALFLALAASLIDVAIQYENQKLSDPAAKAHVQDAISSVSTLLLGTP